jgi:PAS domain-containing protein
MTSNASINQGKVTPASGRGSSLELALEVSELRYRRLFETAQDGILILDAKEPHSSQAKEASQYRAAA